jgi:general secretion pathway protein B
VSFILDALRKSEHERQRQLGPSIAELPVARPAPRVPPWVWVALAALLTLNVAVVAWFLSRETPAAPPPPVADAPADTIPAAPPPSPAPTAAPVMTPPPAANPAPALAEATPAPAGAPPAGPVPQPVEAAPPPAPAMREVRPLTEEAAAEPAFSAPAFAAPAAPDPALLPAPPPPSPRQAPVTAGIPTIDQLPPQATAGLPPLSVSLHIYANQPAQRAVFINGARYREGDSLPGGAVVREITPDGAVIAYGGQRFLLPRQ